MQPGHLGSGDHKTLCCTTRTETSSLDSEIGLYYEAFSFAFQRSAWRGRNANYCTWSVPCRARVAIHLP